MARVFGGQVHPKTSTIRPRVHPMQSGPSQWSRFNVTRIRTTLSFSPSTRVTARATNPCDYRAWRKRGRLTGPRRQGSRKRGTRKGARKSKGREREREMGRERESDKARERVQCFVRARWTRRHSDRRLFIIASSGRRVVQGGLREERVRDPRGTESRGQRGRGRTRGVKRVRQRCRGNRRAEGRERMRERERRKRGTGERRTLVCNEGVAADHTRPKNTLSTKPTPFCTVLPQPPPGGNESSIKRRYQCVTSGEFSLSLSLSFAIVQFLFSLYLILFFVLFLSLSPSLSPRRSLELLLLVTFFDRR